MLFVHGRPWRRLEHSTVRCCRGLNIQLFGLVRLRWWMPRELGTVECLRLLELVRLRWRRRLERGTVERRRRLESFVPGKMDAEEVQDAGNQLCCCGGRSGKLEHPFEFAVQLIFHGILCTNANVAYSFVGDLQLQRGR